eukprot:360603-Chlamydomonas_euryale.AAC.2
MQHLHLHMQWQPPATFHPPHHTSPHQHMQPPPPVTTFPPAHAPPLPAYCTCTTFPPAHAPQTRTCTCSAHSPSINRLYPSTSNPDRSSGAAYSAQYV